MSTQVEANPDDLSTTHLLCITFRSQPTLRIPVQLHFEYFMSRYDPNSTRNEIRFKEQDFLAINNIIFNLPRHLYEQHVTNQLEAILRQE
jgi:hypothetical protein